MKRLEPDPRHQTAWTHAQPAKGGSAAAVVPQRPKVPAGIFDVGTKPQAATPSRPMAAPVGAGPLVAAGTLQFGEAEGPQLSGAPGAGNSAASAQRSSSLAEAAIDAKEAIVGQALAALKSPDKPEQRDLVAALQILNRGYANASPEVRKLILDDDITRYVVSEAVKKVTVALTDETVIVIDKSGRRAHPQGRADDAMEHINQLVHGFDRDFAGVVVNEAMLAFRGFYQSCQSQIYSRLPDNSVFGGDGVAALASLADQIAGSPEGDAAIAGFIEMKAWNGAAMLHVMTSGAGYAYAIAYAAYVKTQTGDASFVPRSLAEPRVALQSKLDSDNRALAEHGKEMAWVAKYVCEPLGPELAKKAMDGYLASKSVDWKKEDERLSGQVVESRARLVRHMIALNKIAPALAPSMREQWEAIAKDPVACQAIEDALGKDPDFITGDGLKDVADLLATIQNMVQKEKRPLGQLAFLAVRMTNVAATAFLQRTVLKKLDGLKPGDPAGAVKIAEALDGLRNKWFAKILGWSEADIDHAVTLVKEAAAGYAENSRLIKVAMESGKLAEMEVGKLAAQLDAAVTAKLTAGINKLTAFNGATIAGRMMKGLVAAMGIFIYTWGSVQATINHLNVENAVRTAAMGALASIRTADLLVSLGLFSSTSAVGLYAAATLGDVGRLAAKLGDVPGVDRLAATLAEVPAVQRLVGGKLAAKLAMVPIAEVYLEIYAGLEFTRGVKAAVDDRDAVQAGISGVTAVGFGMTFAPRFGAALWSGPVGATISAVALFGQIIYDGVKDAKYAHQYEKASEICLKAAGFNPVAAAKLGRQPSYFSWTAGAGQMPLLAQLAKYRNVSVLELVNDLTTDEVTERGEEVYEENADRVDRLSEIVLYEMSQGAGDPTAHLNGKWYPNQPPVRQVSSEVAERRRWNMDMRLLEHALVREKILDPEKVMPDEPFWQDP